MADKTQPSESQSDSKAAILELSILLEGAISSRDALRSIIDKYPQYAGELSDYILQSSATGAGDLVSELDESSEIYSAFDTIASKVSDRLRNSNLLSGVFSRASELGLSQSAVVSETGLALSILRKLDQRLIELSSIPAQILESLSELLQIQKSQLDTFLAGPPRLASGANYKSRKTPSASRKQSFQDALRAAVKSGEMSVDESRKWMNQDSHSD